MTKFVFKDKSILERDKWSKYVINEGKNEVFDLRLEDNSIHG